MRKYIVGIVFIAIGIIAGIVAVFVGINTSSKNYEKITGVISRIYTEESYDAETGETTEDSIFFVSYEYGGKKYKDIQLDYYDAFHGEGDKIDFYVNADDPKEITKSLSFKTLIVIGLAVMFLGSGIFVIVKTKKSSNYMGGGEHF